MIGTEDYSKSRVGCNKLIPELKEFDYIFLTFVGTRFSTYSVLGDGLGPVVSSLDL